MFMQMWLPSLLSAARDCGLTTRHRIIERLPRVPQAIAQRIDFLLFSAELWYNIQQAFMGSCRRSPRLIFDHASTPGAMNLLLTNFMSPNRTTSVELASKEAQRVRAHNGYFHEYTDDAVCTWPRSAARGSFTAARDQYVIVLRLPVRKAIGRESLDFLTH
ncbi:hypothetical protein EDB85DRAFT_1567983 [Lactarius pseudohatsudake]|nr:hypothetical protein EDB85DRAFT_1567983 [Lactarius pseudohatsudake]